MTSIFTTANRISRIMNLHHNTTKKYLKVLRVPTYKIGKRTYYKTNEVLPLLEGYGVKV